MKELLDKLNDISISNQEFKKRVTSKDNFSFERSAYVLTLQNWTIAWNEVLNIKDLNQAKQYFNENGFIDLTRAESFNHRLFDMQNPRDNFCSVALSDNPKLVRYYSDIDYIIKYTSRGKDVEITFRNYANKGELVAIYSLCILNIFKNNFDELKKSLDIFRNTLETKKQANVLKPDYDFLVSILNKDKDSIKESIERFLTKKLHNQRMRDELILKEFINQPAILYLKLSWILGIEIEIDNKLIPMELMPIKPLERYQENYLTLINKKHTTKAKGH